MARIASILKALSKVISRDQKSIWALVRNTFVISTIFYMQDAGGFIYLLIGAVILFPLSTDPLSKIPPSRFSVWPLSARDKWALRLSSPFVNPITWAVLALVVATSRGKVSLPLAAMGITLVVAGFVMSALPVGPRVAAWRWMPQFPGPLNQLIRKNLRGLLATLDVYIAMLLSISLIAYRIMIPTLPKEALLVMTVLMVLALASYMTCLFGLDGAGGASRYRLLPLRGWQILAAKDIACLVILAPLTLAGAPLAGIGSAMVGLAVGHRNSVLNPRRQLRWRFSAGGVYFSEGLIQVAAIAAAASWIFLYSAWVVVPCCLALAVSLWRFGRILD